MVYFLLSYDSVMAKILKVRHQTDDMAFSFHWTRYNYNLALKLIFLLGNCNRLFKQ